MEPLGLLRGNGQIPQNPSGPSFCVKDYYDKNIRRSGKIELKLLCINIVSIDVKQGKTHMYQFVYDHRILCGHKKLNKKIYSKLY